MWLRAIPKAAILAAFAVAGPAVANNGVVIDENGRDRVNHANRLGMLAERIPAAACAEAAGIATDQSGPILQIASNSFERVLDALEGGNGAMNIRTPEDDRRILEDIAAMRAVWEPLVPAIDAIVDAQDPNYELAIRDAAPTLNDRAVRLTSRISGHYADPAQLLQRDALAIEIAGRQRMLVQRMALNACVLAGAPDDGDALEELRADHEMYAVSLDALRFGLPEAGISPPPNATIAGDLETISGAWTQVSPLIAQLASGSALSNDENDLVYTEMNRLLGLMNTTVYRYALASRQNL